MMHCHNAGRVVAAALLLPLLAACGDDSDPVGPAPAPAAGEIVVDASVGFSYLAMSGDSLVPVVVSDASTSTAWDIGFSGLSTVVNGGNAGPGSASAFCLCPAVNPSIAEVAALDPAVGSARFAAVTLADVPAASAFQTDTLVTAARSWYTGTAGAGAAANTDRVFVFVAGQQAPLYGKFQITGITGATTASPGSVTLRWSIQSAPGAPFGATQTRTVAVGAAPVYLDLVTGTETTSTERWHLAFDGWRLRTNGGASAIGNVGVSVTFSDNTPFDVLSPTIAQSVPFTAFARDGFAGAFAQPDRQWEYQSSNQTVYPTFDVYLLRRADTVFKLQFTSYYDLQGQSRRLTIRYQRLQ